MRRYRHDYGCEFQSARKRPPLTRAEAARVIAAPLPKRASNLGKPIAGHLASGRVFDAALVAVWIALVAILIWG